MTGRFITLEGGEGSGKSTQARLLANALTATEVYCFLTREPGGAPAAEEIRRLLTARRQPHFDPLSEAFLHSAARREHWTAAIEPALQAGQWVVCDRFTDSTRAYQGAALGVDLSLVESLITAATGGHQPDMTLILDIAPEEGLARAQARGAADHYESLNIEHHRVIRKAFLDIARDEPDRCVVIDAGAGVEEIREAIFTAIEKRFAFSLSRAALNSSIA